MLLKMVYTIQLRKAYKLIIIFGLLFVCFISAKNESYDMILQNNLVVAYSCYKKSDLKYYNPPVEYIFLRKGINIADVYKIKEKNHNPTYYLTKIGGVFICKKNSIEVAYSCCEKGNVSKGIVNFLELSNNDSLYKEYQDLIKLNQLDSISNSNNIQFNIKEYSFEYNVKGFIGEYCYCTDWHPFVGFAYENASDSICYIKRTDSLFDIADVQQEKLNTIIENLMSNYNPKKKH